MTNTRRKVLFAAHDPGGYNLLDPLIEELINNDTFDIYLALIGPALERAKRKEGWVKFILELSTNPIKGFENEKDVDFSEYFSFFTRINPDLVFVSTSINSNIERYSIHFAKQSGKPNFVYIDSWTGDEVRFESSKISVTPEHIIVCDKYMAQPYQKFEKLGSIVHVAGNMHLERLYQNRTTFSKHLHTDNLRVLFVTENIAHYYPQLIINEFVIINNILQFYNIPQDIVLIIRPHPLESRLEWKTFIENNSGKNDLIKLALDDSPSINIALSKSDMVIGISTMALIESSIIGIPTFSYQIDITESSMLYIPYDFYNIGIIKTKNEFNELVRNYETKKSKKEQFDFPFLGARERIISLLHSYAR
jgi:hypothetical protein